MDNFLTPVTRNPSYVFGPLSTFEDTESRLVRSGLLRTTDTPGRAYRCNTRSGCQDYVVTAYRLKSGRIRLTLSDSLIPQRCDPAFNRFLAVLIFNGDAA